MALVPWKYSNPYCNASKLSRRCFTFCGNLLEIRQAPDSDIDAKKNTHQKMWDGAYVLSSFLESDFFPRDYWHSKRCIELGSGTGLVGMTSWLHGAHITLTDKEDCLDRTKENVRENVERLCRQNKSLDSSKITVKPLTWGLESEAAALCMGAEDKAVFDVVLASEVVYIPELAEPLIKTLTFLCSEKTSVFLSYKPRGLGEDLFWSLLPRYGFKHTSIKQAFLPSEFQESAYTIHHIEKHSASIK